MSKKMLIDAVHAGEARVVILDDSELYDYDFVTASKTQLKGNVFLAKITRVEPSLQAAFVEYGGNRQGFLPFSEIHPDYYQLPQEDKRKLLEEQIAEAEAEEAAEEEAFEREQAAREAREQTMDAAGSLEEIAEAEDDGVLPPLSDEDADDTALDDVTFAPLNSESFTVSSEPLEDISAEEALADEAEVASQGALMGEVERAELAAVVEQPEEGALIEQPVSSDVETVSGEDSGDDRRHRRNNTRSIHRRYRIQEVIKRNQIVLVQVTKEERGNKGCSLTTYVSLAGRYCVLMPNSPKGGGISRKITDRTTRKRLKEVLGEMRTHRGMSVIIRTAGIDRARPEIRRDYEYLVKLWNQIREQTLSSVAPSLIYEETDLIKRAIRDLYTSDIDEIVIDGESAFNEAKTFMQLLMPTHVEKVRLHHENLSLFASQGVDEMLQEMSEPQVRLPSGGYLVINPTEALISIDVNSGRSTTERNVEETALKTNIEAAHEVARQLRLRDLAGLVVIDFIDMNFHKNRRNVERAMRDALREDRAKIQLGRISTFGLMELSRQRMRPSISESMGIPCPHCKGSGHIHSVETVGIQIIRTLEKEAASGDYITLRVSTYADAALHLLNEKRALLQSIEARYNVKVMVLIDAGILSGNYRLIKVTAEGKEVAHETTRQPRKRSSRRGGASGGNNRPRRNRYQEGGGVSFTDAADDEGETASENVSSDEGDVASDASSEHGTGENADRPRRGRGGRGRRGGRRNRGDRPERSENGEAVAPEGESGERPEHSERGDRPGRGPRHRRDRKPREDRTAESGDAPAREPSGNKSADIIPMRDAPKPQAVLPPDITPQDDDKPKRKGWWSRVLEN